MERLLYLVLLCAFGLVSCKNYQEGPYFTLQSRAARIANTWEVHEAFGPQGDTLTAFLADMRLVFESDGQAQLSYRDQLYQLIQWEGTWELVDNRDGFAWQMSGDTTAAYYELEEMFDIYRLTANDFWLIDKNNATIYLKPAEE